MSAVLNRITPHHLETLLLHNIENSTTLKNEQSVYFFFYNVLQLGRALIFDLDQLFNLT